MCTRVCVCASACPQRVCLPVRTRCCHLFDVPLVLVVHLLWLDEVLAGGLELLFHLGDSGGEGGHALLHLGQFIVLLLQQVLQLHHLARLMGRLQRAVGQTLGRQGYREGRAMLDVRKLLWKLGSGPLEQIHRLHERPFFSVYGHKKSKISLVYTQQGRHGTSYFLPNTAGWSRFPF